jgi:hypothetical protein
MSNRYTTALAAVVAAALSESALAYVGPGAGLSLLGALWGLLAAVVAALAFVVVWPIRRMRRQRAANHQEPGTESKTNREDQSIQDGSGREASRG